MIVFWQIFCDSGSLCLSCTLFLSLYLYKYLHTSLLQWRKVWAQGEAVHLLLDLQSHPHLQPKAVVSTWKSRKRTAVPLKGVQALPQRQDEELVIKKILWVELLLLKIRRSQVRCFGQEDRGLLPWLLAVLVAFWSGKSLLLPTP